MKVQYKPFNTIQDGSNDTSSAPNEPVEPKSIGTMAHGTLYYLCVVYHVNWYFHGIPYVVRCMVY